MDLKTQLIVTPDLINKGNRDASLAYDARPCIGSHERSDTLATRPPPLADLMVGTEGRTSPLLTRGASPPIADAYNERQCPRLPLSRCTILGLGSCHHHHDHNHRRRREHRCHRRQRRQRSHHHDCPNFI